MRFLVLLAVMACEESGGRRKSDADTLVACEDGLVVDTEGECVLAACQEIPAGDVYVLAGAESGDGSRESPYATIQEGADAGGIVVIGLGTYGEVVLDERHHGVHLRGRCREGVTIESSGEPAIDLDGDRETAVTVSDFTLVGGGASNAGGSLALERASIEEAVGIGLLASGRGVTVDLAEVTVIGTRSDGGNGGGGMRVEDGATLNATAVTFTGNVDVGVAIVGSGTEATLVDVTIEETGEATRGEDGWGLYVDEGATVVGTQVVVSRNHSVGVLVGSSGSSLTLEDSLIEGTLAGDNDAVGYGLQVAYGGDVVLRRTDVLNNLGLAMVAYGSGATLTLEDVLVDGVNGPEGISRDCVYVGDRARVDAVRLEATRCGTVGVAVETEGEAILTDVWIHAPRTAVGNYGAAIHVSEEGVVEVAGLLVEEAGAAGVVVEGPGSELHLVDATIQDGRGIDGQFGWGVAVDDGGTLVAERLTLDDMQEAGVVSSGAGASATLVDLVIAGTRRSANYQGAAMVVAQDEGTVDLDGFSMTDNGGPGLVAFGGILVARNGRVDRSAFAGAVLLAGRMELEGVSVGASVLDPGLGGGVGLFASTREAGSYGAPVLVARELTVEAQPLAAVWIEDGAGGLWDLEGIDLEGGPGLTLSDRVTVHGNAIYALDTTTWDGTQGLRVIGATLHDAGGAALLLDGGDATLEGVVWTGNAVDVVQQRCDDGGAGSFPSASRVQLCPDVDQITLDLDYATLLGEVSADR